MHLSWNLLLNLRRCPPVSKGRPPIVTPGQVVPNIAALSETTKDWLYSGHLFVPPHPPMYAITSAAIMTNWLSGLGSLYRSGSPLGTASFDYGPAALPPVLPSAKREMPVVGFRAWNFSSKFRVGVGRDVALRSTGVNFHWKPGENHAICSGATSGPGGHVAPDPNCHCGFYVLANLDEVESHQAVGDGIVVGAVMGWGKVVQHGKEGWRAEYAKIIALLDCKYSKGQLRNTQQAAAAYEVEVKSRDGLEAMLSEFGDPFAA
jgi:hypothetical protein